MIQAMMPPTCRVVSSGRFHVATTVPSGLPIQRAGSAVQPIHPPNISRHHSSASGRYQCRRNCHSSGLCIKNH